ncbi:MAG: FKBP-type peptidyl-prolyl cis-trans isomerase [Oligoflexales bacterium]|nr:FKBP-type peptidyl-prolyl cis-trans isomerase [Oligoflexales bacterium]
MKKTLPIFIVIFMSCTKEKSVQFENEEDKVFYTLGQMYARRVENLNLQEKEAEWIHKGFTDWVLHRKSEVNFDEYRRTFQGSLEKRIESVAKTEKEKGKQYLEAYLKNGGTLSKQGFAYKVLNPGNEHKPTEKSIVEVHYHGTFTDGRVFDSSIDKKEKVKFPLNAVIKGWTEGLQLIGEGGEIELVLPSHLAYGDKGSPPQIPGGATLKFTIQLFTIQ